MKKKIAGRLGLTALALTFITTSVMSGTLAKYTMDVTATATATVAKFSFNLNGSDATTGTYTIPDLFTNSYKNTSGEEIVKGETSNANVVAPGTSGKTKIEITNTGEVAIKAETIEIKETNTGKIPLQYAITTDGIAPTNTAKWTTYDQLNIPAEVKTKIDTATSNNSKSFYLHWRWDPSSNDTADTNLGTNATPAQVSLTIDLTVSQYID